MALLGKAVLCVWNDVDPAIEDDYDDWYLREHIPERISVPGILRGRRYRAAEGSPKFMALYEALTLDVLTSGAYRTQLANPTEWTRRVMPGFRLMQRGLCDVVASAGSGVGGMAAIVHLTPKAAGGAALRAWAEALLPKIMALRQVSGVHVWALAPGEPVTPTTQLVGQGAVARAVNWVVCVEGTGRGAVEAGRDLVLASDPGGHGAAGVLIDPIYDLLFVGTADG
jgi:hypothetical protein